MKVTSRPAVSRSRYHPEAHRFVFDALQFTQESLRRPQPRSPNDENAHITGQELCEGIRSLAVKRFGLLARTVFAYWGIHSTADFGRIVFELIERGEMKKTDSDTLADFSEVFDFDEALDQSYVIDTDQVFRR